jgi:RND family efflux transporter MFP subunit
VLFLAGLVAVAAGGGYLVFKDRLSPAPLVETDTVRVMTGGQASTVLSATGYLESRYQTSVGAKSPGRIWKILFEEGDEVREHQLLAELEHQDLDAMLESRKASKLQAEADLAETKTNLAQKERDLKRETAVRQKGAGAEAALEAAQTAFATARIRVQALEAAVALAESHVNEALVAIDDMKVYAPFAGTILTQDADRGETIMPGGMGAASGRGSVATLADLKSLEVDTDVKEDYLSRIHRGQPAEVMVDAVEGVRYKGQVRQIIPIGDRSRGIVKVKVEVLEPDERLFPDLSATVNFLPDAAERSAGALAREVFAPAAAVVSRDGESFVWKITGDRLDKIIVKTEGEPHDGVVRIVAGLAGGETVVVDPSPDFQSGGRIRQRAN